MPSTKSRRSLPPEPRPSPPRKRPGRQAEEAASEEDISLEAILEDLKRREGRSG